MSRTVAILALLLSAPAAPAADGVRYLLWILLAAAPAWPAAPLASDDEAAATRLTERTLAVLATYVAEGDTAGDLVSLRQEVKRLEESGLAVRVQRRLEGPDPALGERLVNRYLGALATLEELSPGYRPSAVALDVADLVHLHGEHTAPLTSLREFHPTGAGSGWYGAYLVRRARAMTERIRQTSAPLAVALLQLLVAMTNEGSRHMLSLERALLAALAHSDANVRAEALRVLVPGPGPLPPAVRTLYLASDALRARVEALRANDTSPAVRRHLQSLPPAAPAPLVAETAMSHLASDAEGGEWIDNPRYRFRAVATLFARPEPIGSAARRDRLLALLHADPNEAVRWRVVQSLFDHRVEDPRYLPALVSALHHDPSAAIRRALAGMLEPLREGDRAVAIALSRAYVQGRIPERREGWDCRDVIRLE